MCDEAPKYDKDDLFRLLCQVETLQHQRVYYLLVAETIFYLAAATALAAPSVVIALALGGIVTAVLFTFTNYKLYLRIVFLITPARKQVAIRPRNAQTGFQSKNQHV